MTGPTTQKQDVQGPDMYFKLTDAQLVGAARNNLVYLDRQRKLSTWH